MVGALAIAAVISASRQPYGHVETLSTAFLTSLIHLSQSQVGIINVPVSSVMIIDRNAPDAPVVILRGSGTFLWAQIARQLSHSVSKNEPMHLKVERWSIPAAACPSAADHIREFLARLAEAGKEAVDRPADSALEEIVMDGPAFRIISKGRDALVTFEPYHTSNPLQEAAGRLDSAFSSCTNSISPSVEQHDF